MTNAYVLTGTLTDPQTLKLSEPLPVGAGEVRVVIELLRPKAGEPAWKAVMEQVWKEQDARGYTPPTAEEVIARVREEREGWND